jgi:hypothetical protein
MYPPRQFGGGGVQRGYVLQKTIDVYKKEPIIFIYFKMSIK